MKGRWRMFVENIEMKFSITGVLIAIPLNMQGGFQQTRAINWYMHGTGWIVAMPGFLIAGPVMAYRRYRLVEVPDHVTGTCPTNKEKINLPLEASTRLPVWTHCQQCKTSIQLLEKNERYAF